MTDTTFDTTSPSQAQEAGRERDVVTLVLTADNHLGYSAFGQQPRKREVLQQRLRAAFQQATNFALAHEVDLFIQAGDLFDTPTPNERDRSFVAERLIELKQKGIQTFAVGGLHDTSPSSAGSLLPSPLVSYEHLGALRFFPAFTGQPVLPLTLDVHGVRLALSGLSVTHEQEFDPFEQVQLKEAAQDVDLSLLLLHAPLASGEGEPSLLGPRAQVNVSNLASHLKSWVILAGYAHVFQRQTVATSELVVAGTTQHLDFSTLDATPGFVYMGVAADGIRWCEHIPVESLALRLLSLATNDLWKSSTETEEDALSPTKRIIEHLRPLCAPDTLVLLRLSGSLSRAHYHQLDLNQIRRFGEDECFALAIDDSELVVLADLDLPSSVLGERFSPREELIALADEWIADAFDEQEKLALKATKEELLSALDDPARRSHQPVSPESH